MPREYFDIREDEQFSIKIKEYPCLFNMQGERSVRKCMEIN